MRTPYEILQSSPNERYHNTFKLLQKFRDTLDWEDINRQFIIDFKDFILKKSLKKDGTHYNPNYFRLCYGFIKTIVKNNRPDLLDAISGIKIKTYKTSKVFLTKEELKKIEITKMYGRENIVKIRFLIGAYTGARYSDFKNLSYDNIQGKFLKYMAQKTNAVISVPVHPYVRKQLKKGIPEFDFEKENTEVKYFNDTIKKICFESGINSTDIYFQKNGDKIIKEIIPKWKKVSSHTARRSFATNLAMEKGVSMQYIQKLLGHASVMTTENYVLCDSSNFEEMAGNIEFFK